MIKKYYAILKIFGVGENSQITCPDLNFNYSYDLDKTPADIIGIFKKKLQEHANNFLVEYKTLPQPSKKGEAARKGQFQKKHDFIFIIEIKEEVRHSWCSYFLPGFGAVNTVVAAITSSITDIVAIQVAASQNRDLAYAGSYTSASLNFIFTLALYYVSGATENLQFVGGLLDNRNKKMASQPAYTESNCRWLLRGSVYFIGHALVLLNNYLGAVSTYQEDVSLASTPGFEKVSISASSLKTVAWFAASSGFITNTLFQSSLAHRAIKQFANKCCGRPKQAEVEYDDTVSSVVIGTPLQESNFKSNVGLHSPLLTANTNRSDGDKKSETPLNRPRLGSVS